MVRVRFQGRLAAAAGHVRPTQGKGDFPHGGRRCRKAPSARERDCPARPRTLGSRPDLDAQYSMTPEQERKSYKDSATTIERVTGVRPVGFNAFWLRGTPQTLQILQELGYTYYIDDVSRDEPFLVNVRNKPFAVVPYTLHMNDIVNYETRYFSTDAYAADLKREFDVLYEEGAYRRRMMSVSAHDRIAGRPARIRVLEEC